MNITTFRPNYFFKRLRVWRFERENPNAPWLTESAVLFLENWLRSTDVGLEWGSGRSTTWLAERVAALTSIESDSKWYGQVSNSLKIKKLDHKVSYRYVPCTYSDHDNPDSHPYCDIAGEFPDSTFDFVLVDGKIRGSCIAKAMAKVKPGGVIILDNSERYLPNRFLHGYTSVVEPRNEPKNHFWACLLSSLDNWRSINTTNGISDTRIWVR